MQDRKESLGRVGLPLSGLGAWLLAMVVPAPASWAQSPFTQPPSPSGTFTIPSSPSPAQSPFAPRRTPPGSTPPPPSLGGRSPFRPPPAPSAVPPRVPSGEMVPPRAGELSARPVLPLPIPTPPGGAPSGRPRPLPPGPEVMPPLSAAPTAPVPKAAPLVLRAGATVTLRICQVIPSDGLTSGERLLNSRPAIQPGDCFLAEMIEPRGPYPVLVGGTVTGITEPGRFGRPGYVSLQMTQLVQTAKGGTGWIPWRMDMADRRFVTRMRRVLLSVLLGLEGAGTGASIGAQFSGGNMAFIGGGMGIGAIVGMGYASFRRGTEANLEPGDMFEIVVGTADYRPIAREWQTILYPAAKPVGGKGKHQP